MKKVATVRYSFASVQNQLRSFVAIYPLNFAANGIAGAISTSLPNIRALAPNTAVLFLFFLQHIQTAYSAWLPLLLQ